jgi:hypothetical protein
MGKDTSEEPTGQLDLQKLPSTGLPLRALSGGNGVRLYSSYSEARALFPCYTGIRLALRSPPPVRAAPHTTLEGTIQLCSMPLAPPESIATLRSCLSWTWRSMPEEGSWGHRLGGWQEKDIHRIPSLQSASDSRQDVKD